MHKRLHAQDYPEAVRLNYIRAAVRVLRPADQAPVVQLSKFSVPETEMAFCLAVMPPTRAQMNHQ